MITIVEPHADDAFLSLGGHIEQWIKEGVSVKILTVYSGTRKRAKDAQAYARAMGCAWEGLGFIEDGGGAAGGTGELPDGALYDVADGEKILAPLGISHPEHALVRSRFPASRFYLDQPYASQCKNREEVNQKLINTQVLSFMRPNARKYRHIPLFKDQAKFFYYNPSDVLKYNIELIVEDVL
ncbi:MAG: PIG-L family deacetylase [Candidatus Electrothrix sp.]